MGQHVLSFTIKLALFCAVMLLVAKIVPYEGLVDQLITNHFGFGRCQSVTRFIEGEPAPECWEALNDYFSTFINTIISVPLMSLVITIYNTIRQRSSLSDSGKLWIKSTTRRFSKILGFTLIFMAVFRFFPYDSIIGESNNHFSLAAVAGFNLCFATTIYLLITKLVFKSRRK